MAHPGNIVAHCMPLSQGERARLKKQLAAYNADVATLQAKLAEIHSQLNETYSQIQLTTRKLFWAHVLPLDVVCEIIDRWVEVDECVPLTAMLVCRRWYEAVYTHPAAWRKIWIKPPLARTFAGAQHCEERVATWLKKAGDSSLDIRVVLYTSRVDKFDRSRHVDCAWFELNTPQLQCLQRSFGEVCKKSISWERLSVYHVIQSSLSFQYFIQTMPNILRTLSGHLATTVGNLGRLQSWTVHNTTRAVSRPGVLGPNSPNERLRDTWFPGPPPNVADVVYLGHSARPSSFSSSSALRSLTIGRCLYSLDDILALVHSAPALQVLNLIEVYVLKPRKAHRTPFIHTSLAELSMREFDNSSRRMQNVTKRLLGGLLTLPNLRLFHLSRDVSHKFRMWREPPSCREKESKDVAVALLNLMGRSKAPLTELHIISPTFDDHRFVKMLRLTPLLTTLEVRIPENHNIIAELLTAPDPAENDNHILCPHLKCLILLDCQMSHMKVIKGLAEAREQLDAEQGSFIRGRGPMLRAIHWLHVHGSYDEERMGSELKAVAKEIEKKMQPGTFLYSDGVLGEYPKAAERMVIRPEWNVSW